MSDVASGSGASIAGGADPAGRPDRAGPDRTGPVRPGEPADPTRPGDPAVPLPSRRRRTLLAVLAGVVVLGGGAGVAFGVLGVGREPAGPPPGTVVLPSPTPTVDPVARQPVSTFADSLPSSVLGFALTSLAEHQPLLLAGAVEGYRLDYADGGGGSLTVTAGQWETDAEATSALAAASAAAGAGAVPVTDGGPTSGEVQVGGAVVGTWALTQAPDGTGTVTWSNGTVVLQATAAADVVRDVYAAYPY